MFNFKWGLIASAAALIISIVLGIISGVAIFHIIIRALIFAVVFFGLGIGIYMLINSFFPELLSMDEGASEQAGFDQPGSRINITLDNAGEYAVPELYRNSGEPQELGNIEDLVSGAFKPRIVEPSFQTEGFEGIDQKGEDDYNSMGGDQDAGNQEGFKFQDLASFEETPNENKAPVFTPIFGDDSAGLGGLPDLDSMAMAFSSDFGDPPVQAHPQTSEDEKPSQYNKGNKPQPLKGDFDAKELAEGIRTVLKKEK